MKWILMASLALVLTSCNTYQIDAQKGCANYEPLCLSGGTRLQCVTTQEGCRSCTCIPSNTLTTDPGQPWP